MPPGASTVAPMFMRLCLIRCGESSFRIGEVEIVFLAWVDDKQSRTPCRLEHLGKSAERGPQSARHQGQHVRTFSTATEVILHIDDHDGRPARVEAYRPAGLAVIATCASIPNPSHIERGNHSTARVPLYRHQPLLAEGTFQTSEFLIIEQDHRWPIRNRHRQVNSPTNH